MCRAYRNDRTRQKHSFRKLRPRWIDSVFLFSCVATPQKKNMKRQDINDLREIWGTDGKVLEVLQQLVQVASHLSFAVRAPSHNDLELSQLDLLARDVVSSSDRFLLLVV